MCMVDSTENFAAASVLFINKVMRFPVLSWLLQHNDLIT